ncbi:MAG: hypothetical protein LUF68_02710 [Clostridiales bacterium]|nr:hypothetical protein [Clostridiales bacterium]
MSGKVTLKNGIKAVAFLVVFALLLHLSTELLRSKWTDDNQDRYVLQNFYDLDEDSLDVLILGSSQVIYGVDPVELYDYAGISAYCLGGASASLMSNYYWLIEVEKTQSPSVILLETSSLLEKIKEYQERKRVDEMRFSLNRLWFIRDLTGLSSVSESFVSYLFPMIKYHTRWSALTAKDFGVGLDYDLAYRGFDIADTCKNGLDYDLMIIDNDDPEENVRELYSYQQEYFVKIAEYCQENDIELVLFKTPKYSWKASDAVQVQALADEYGLTYLDYNWEALLLSFDYNIDTDMKDYDHLSTLGAGKFSDCLADYLTANFDLPDRREDPDYDLQINRDAYDQEHTDAALVTTTDAVEWLTLLTQHTTCDVFIATNGDVSGQVSDEIAALLAQLGLETDLNTLASGDCLVAWLTNDGTSVEEVAQAGKAQISGTLGNGVSYSIVSKNQNGTATAELSIDSSDTCINGAGLNIRVYSEDRLLALETVCIDLETGEMTCKPRSG